MSNERKCTCGHLLRWHRTSDGDCLHDGCACEKFTPEQHVDRGRNGRRKYPVVPPEELAKYCGVCRNGQHSSCTGRRIKPGHPRSPKSPKVPCECPRHGGEGSA